MAELGIIASVAHIADVGLRLSIKLYTFGEIVASADRSVLSISKDVSLTSGVLKELGHLLDKDREARTFSENAVQTADGVVKECLEVFREMEDILVKKMPGLAKGDGKGGGRTKRAAVLLERLKWGYLQPKLQLLRSNLDRLKSTLLLLMLNVITYARQVSGRTESPSLIADQRCLIEDLAHSNQEYIRKFENLKLGIEGSIPEHVNHVLNTGAIESKPSTTTRPLPSKFALGATSLPYEENTQSLGSGEAPSNLTRPPVIPSHTDVENPFISTSVQAILAMPPIQGRGIPTAKPPICFSEEVLFKQLQHYSTLIQNLLKEVDEAQYKITFKSRLRVKGGIAGLHESERHELERLWGGAALQSAEQRLDSLVEGLGEMPRMNGIASREHAQHFSLHGMKPVRKSSSMVTDHGLDNGKRDEATLRIPQATSDGRLFHSKPLAASTMADIPYMRGSACYEVVPITRSPADTMAGAYARNDSIAESDYVPSDNEYIQTSDPVQSASTQNPRSGESSAPAADADAKTAEERTIMRGNRPITSSGREARRVLGRKNLKGLALNNAPKVASPVGSPQMIGPPRGDVEGTNGPAGAAIGTRPLWPEVKFGEDESTEAQSIDMEHGTAPGEHFRQGQDEVIAERREKVRDNSVATTEGGPMTQMPVSALDARDTVSDVLQSERYFELIGDPASVPTPNLHTESLKQDITPRYPMPGFAYLPMPVTSADDPPLMTHHYTGPNSPPFMAHNTETSRPEEESFADGLDESGSLFDQTEEKTNTGAVPHGLGSPPTYTYNDSTFDRSSPRPSHQASLSYTSDAAPRTGDKRLPATTTTEEPHDTVPVKRARNTMAARKSRKKGEEQTEHSVNQVTQLEAEAGYRKNVAPSMYQADIESHIRDVQSQRREVKKGEGDVILWSGSKDDQSNETEMIAPTGTLYNWAGRYLDEVVEESLDDAEVADMKVVDRLVLLWTTVKPL